MFEAESEYLYQKKIEEIEAQIKILREALDNITGQGQFYSVREELPAFKICADLALEALAKCDAMKSEPLKDNGDGSFTATQDCTVEVEISAPAHEPKELKA